jgi:hypothetical protein
MSTAASPDSKKHQSTPPTRMINVWWILLALLLLWNIADFLFLPDNSPVVTLPYSVFIEQEKDDNVSLVNIIGASRVRDLFNKAKEAAPAILFVDELDAVGRRRDVGDLSHQFNEHPVYYSVQA